MAPGGKLGRTAVPLDRLDALALVERLVGHQVAGVGSDLGEVTSKRVGRVDEAPERGEVAGVHGGGGQEVAGPALAVEPAEAFVLCPEVGQEQLVQLRHRGRLPIRPAVDQRWCEQAHQRRAGQRQELDTAHHLSVCRRHRFLVALMAARWGNVGLPW